MSFKELIDKRYSVRTYATTKVEEAKIQQILATAASAPTARNCQCQRIKILTGEKDLALVDQCTPCRFGAPLALLVCYDDIQRAKRPDNAFNLGEIDASIVQTFMMLQATDLGLGSVWVAHFEPRKACELFHLKDNIKPISFLMVGYPTKDAKPAAPHFQRKNVKELLI